MRGVKSLDRRKGLLSAHEEENGPGMRIWLNVSQEDVMFALESRTEEKWGL